MRHPVSLEVRRNKMNGTLDTSDVLLNRGLNGFIGNHDNFIGDGSAVKEAVRGNRDLD
jgi:hypothetical protein